MNKGRVVVIAVLALLVGSAGGYYFGYDIGFEKAVKKNIISFDECAAAGFPVLESYPSRCSANGETFAQDIGNEIELSDLIVIDNPRPNQAVKSPLLISGKARGYWFFEASAPVRILDEAGNTLAEKFVEAKGGWTTEEFVDFEGEITFNPTGFKKGTLILQNDNPFGLGENTKELRIPIQFE